MVDALLRRTVADIQREVIEQSQRNRIYRLFHAKGDKDKIVAWRVNLNRILHVFNVCSIASSRSLLTFYPQTELAISTHAAVSGISHDVANTQKMVSDTQTIVSDIHRTLA